MNFIFIVTLLLVGFVLGFILRSIEEKSDLRLWPIAVAVIVVAWTYVFLL